MARLNAAQRSAIQRGESPWGAGFQRLQRRLDAFDVALLPTVGEIMYESIVNGSPDTGAPGQPEAEGDLIRSWEVSSPSPTSVAVLSDSPYARANEEGVLKGGKPYVQRSAKGGRFSVKLTRAGFQRIVDAAVARIAQAVA